MKYFKNTDLAKFYSVSEKSVRNWIQSAQIGKLELQLHEENGKKYIANTSKNTFTIEALVQKGKKYKNKRSFKAVTPIQKFYDTYSNKQILDIISNLTIRNEIPLQYSYVDGGAEYWDQFAQRLIGEESPNIITKTIELFETSMDSINLLTSNHARVNVVDLGPGNGLPIKPVLENLVKENRLGRYIAIDISKEMLAIVERNIREWFGDKVSFEGYVRDIRHERFDDLFAEDYADDASIPANLVCLLGGTLSNLRAPTLALQAINSSLGLRDLLIYSEKLDAPNTRRYFDFNVSAEVQKLTPRHKLIIDFLGIDESYYDVRQQFDETKRERSISIVPKLDLSIEFALPGGIRHVELRKGVPITLWRAWVWNTLDVVNQFDTNGFEMMYLARSKDPEYLLMASKLKLEQ